MSDTDTPKDDPETQSETPSPVAPPKAKAGSGSALGVLGFVAALGLGFFAGKWITKPDAAEVELAQGQRLKVDLRGDEPQKGPDDALVTIVEFADFECPYCAKGSDALMAVIKDYDEDVRLIFKHYPLPFHNRAVPAARAAWVAHQEGKFWELHHWLYEGRGDLTDLGGQVTSLGLDPKAFAKATLSPQSAQAVDSDMLSGGKAGVSGTPAYIVNGRTYAGARSEDQWEQIIEAELAAAQEVLDSGVERSGVYAKLMEGALESRGGGAPVGGKPSARKPARRPGEPDPAVAYRVTAQDRPALGPADALVTIVEFSDFQCPFCKRLGPVSHKIVEDNPDVRVVFRQMPLPNHPQARGAAKASLAAHRQGKFWAMHDKIFASGALGETSYINWAEALGLDVEQFKLDMADAAIEKMIVDDTALAKQFGVLATPTSFVNGRYIRGAQSAQSLQIVVDEERAKANKLVEGGVAPADVFAKLMETAATEVTDAG
jgi:protein-disulfide isomerase